MQRNGEGVSLCVLGWVSCRQPQEVATGRGWPPAAGDPKLSWREGGGRAWRLWRGLPQPFLPWWRGGCHHTPGHLTPPLLHTFPPSLLHGMSLGLPRAHL